MASTLADRFMQALQSAEESGQVDPLIELFAQGAELKRQTGDAPESGPDSARRFWEAYLSSARRLRSQFTNVIEAGSTIGLEWVTDVEPRTGTPFQYEGISLLEVDQDRVQRFRTYYDSAKFVQVVSGAG